MPSARLGVALLRSVDALFLLTAVAVCVPLQGVSSALSKQRGVAAGQVPGGTASSVEGVVYLAGGLRRRLLHHTNVLA